MWERPIVPLRFTWQWLRSRWDSCPRWTFLLFLLLFLPESGTRFAHGPGQEGRKDGLSDGWIRPGWRPTRGWAALGARKAAREIMDKQVIQVALSVPLPEEPDSGSEIAQLPWLTESFKRLSPRWGWEPLAFLLQQ